MRLLLAEHDVVGEVGDEFRDVDESSSTGRVESVEVKLHPSWGDNGRRDDPEDDERSDGTATHPREPFGDGLSEDSTRGSKLAGKEG